MNVLQFIKLSLVNVMRLGLSLGAGWPEGRSSSSVSQFMPIMLLKHLPDGSKMKRWLPG